MVTDDPCSVDDLPGGYGNNWVGFLDWYGTVPDPANDVTVRVTAVLNYDNEPNYDYLYLEYESVSGMVEVATFNGTNRDSTGVFIPFVCDLSFTLTPSDYARQALPNATLTAEAVTDADGLRLVVRINWDRPGAAKPLTLIAWIDPLPAAADAGFEEDRVR